MKSKIVVIGASGHAKVIVDIIERQGTFDIVGFIDSFRELGTILMGYRVIGREDAIPELIARQGVIGGIVAIGHNWVRCQMVKRILDISPEFAFVNAVHPSACVGREVAFGNGIAVMGGVSINPGSRIGDFCFLNTNASVDHDNELGEFSCLQPNAATGGNVRIGAYAAISMGATVIHGVCVGAHSVIGAGSTVLTDIPECAVAYGTPCRVIRTRSPQDSYY